MNYYSFYFILAFIWALIYTASFFRYGINSGRKHTAVNALLCCIASTALCIIYLFTN